MIITLKDVARPKLTLACDGRVELKVPPTLPDADRLKLVAAAEELVKQFGVPEKTMRGRFKPFKDAWQFGWDHMKEVDICAKGR